MKKLNFDGKEFQAEKIIKTDTDIIGLDSKGNKLFVFLEIPDFSLFSISNLDGTSCDFDTLVPSTTDLQTQIFNLTTQLVNGGII
ncbi:hypothetical protein [Clostridium sp.]|uniref:hypothetical protein n=1 Tax=Clostridium sp. TaxID=1506 RepID=UPI002638BAF4|nr:hypothetical protein [Clostridium sp.]